MQKPLTVLHLITGLGTGGAERMLTRIVTNSHDPDIRHIVVSMTNVGGFGAEIEAAGVVLYQLDMKGALSTPSALIKLFKISKIEHVDIVQTWLYHADLVGTLFSKLCFFKGKLLWNLRCSDMDRKRYKRYTRILAMLSGIPEMILANSNAGHCYHQKLGYKPKQWRVLPNGIDVEQFKPDLGGRQRLQALLGTQDSDILVGVVARTDPMKAHGLFLKAYARAKVENPNIKVVLLGRGTEKYSGIPGVHVLGERSDVSQIIAGFDALYMPSYSEGFPNVVGEAMACGIPCVVTDVGDAGMIVDGTGFVVRPDDLDAMTEGLDKICALSPAKRQKLGKAARKRVVDNWSLPKIIDDYNKLYMGLV